MTKTKITTVIEEFDVDGKLIRKETITEETEDNNIYPPSCPDWTYPGNGTWWTYTDKTGLPPVKHPGSTCCEDDNCCGDSKEDLGTNHPRYGGNGTITNSY